MWDDEDFVVDFKAVIGMLIIVLRNPLTSIDIVIDSLLANPDGRPSIQIIEKLSCVVSLNGSLHPSLRGGVLHKSNRDAVVTSGFSHRHSMNDSDI